MKLSTLKGAGLTRFDSFAVDFEAVGPGLIAITGPNGAGKTTLLEASGPATLFRELPTRSPSPLQNWTSAQGGSLELGFRLSGHTYSARVAVTPGGQVKAFLSRDGAQMVSGKVREYDEEIAKLLGPASAFYASVFGAQGGRGRFSDLPVRDRKDIFRFYLPEMVRAQRIADVAGERLKGVDLSILESAEREVAEATAEQQRLKDDLNAMRATREVAQRETDQLTPLLEQGRLQLAFRAAVSEARDVKNRADRLRQEAQQAGGQEELEQAEDELRALRQHRDALRTAQAERVMAAEAQRRHAAELERLERAAGLLGAVPCQGQGEFAACPLLTDARVASEAIPDKRKVCDRVAGVAKDCDRTVQRLSTGGELAVPGNEADAEAAVREARKRAGGSAQEVAAALGGLERDLASALGQARELRARLTGDPDPTLTDAQVQDWRVALAAKEHEARELADRIARAEGETTGYVAAEQRAAKRLATARKAHADVPALRLLKDTFGANGVQAYLLDHAGPEVTELVNGLLHHCYGHRFTVRVVTLRELKGGGLGEDFDVFVTDSRTGREGSVDGLSGGEKVIVDEALRAGLSLYASQRRAVQVETLWRDETVGDLDADNSVRYVAMLRRAMEVGGYHQVLFVTHSEDAVAAADAVLRVDDAGSITLEKN